MKSNHPTFASCPKKLDARKTTIIDVYRQHFGRSLPADKQYWTMCASQIDACGELSSESELGQMFGEELITKDQFYGIDIKEDVIASNRMAAPECNWLEGDFFSTMEDAYASGNYNPGIINADFVTMIWKSAPIVSGVMAFLSDIGMTDVMVVANVMATNPYGSGRIPVDFVPDFDEISGEYLKNAVYRRAVSQGDWTLHPELFYYWGTGDRSKTVMSTYCFVKKLMEV